MPEQPQPLSITEHGFKWGPLTVQRTATYRGQLILTVFTEAGQAIDIVVSPKGHQIRVIEDDILLVRPRS